MTREMSRRQQILDWAEQGHIAPCRLPLALKSADIIPDRQHWLEFLDRILLGLGILLLLSGIVFFVAANWNILGKFGHFALLEGLLLTGILISWRLGTQSLAGQAAIIASSLLVGILLALIGQTYQTGADSWELFLPWTLLILPWVLLAGNGILWLIWIALLNMSIITYMGVYHSPLRTLFGADDVSWALFLINTLALILWQLLTTSHKHQWGLRLLATTSGIFITILTLPAVAGSSPSSWAVPVWLLWLAGLYWGYRHKTRDLYILTGAVLSLIVIISTAVGRYLLADFNVGTLFLMTLLVLGLSAAGGWWLRQVLKEINQS
jgi:uncharacterized membrane protein